MVGPTRASLIVIQYGNHELLRRLLDSLRDHQDCRIISEVIVVNNGLSLGQEQIESLINNPFPVPIKIVNNPKKSYSSGVNCGVAASQNEIVIVCNNDIEWIPGYSMQTLMNCINQPKVGVVGPQLVFPDGSWQRSYYTFPSIWTALAFATMLSAIRPLLEIKLFQNKKQKMRRVDYIVGAFMVIRKNCFWEVGGFDEDFSFYAEEADFCYKIWRAGYLVLFNPSTRIVHVGGATSKKINPSHYINQKINSSLQFMVKYHGSVQSYIYYTSIKFGILARARVYPILSKFIKWPCLREDAALYNSVRHMSLSYLRR